MSKLDRLEIIAGAVVDVQIIERQLEASAPVLAAAYGEKAASVAIIGRQRIFIDGPGVADPHYDFDRCELAVRREQEVAFARIPAPSKSGRPTNVMLVNRTMGTQWIFGEGIDALAPPPGIGVAAKALGLAILAGGIAYLVFYYVTMHGAVTAAVVMAVGVGVAAYLVLWVVLAVMRIGERARRRAKVSAAVLVRLMKAPVKAEPVRGKPVKLEPVRVEPAKVEPAKVEPAKIEPAKIEPAKIETAELEPAEVEPAVSQTG
jgi:hypothetical protein